MGFLQNAFEYLLFPILFSLSWLLIRMGILTVKKERISALSCIMTVLFGVYLAILFAMTVSPVYGLSKEIHWNQVNWIPFQVLRTRPVNYENFIGNILMFIPMGIFPMFWSLKYLKFSRTMGLGFIISVCIEGMQLFLSRGTDVDDVLLNTLGTLLGFCMAKIVIGRHREVRNKVKSCQSKGMIGFLCLILVCVLFTGGKKRMSFFENDSVVQDNNVVAELIQNQDEAESQSKKENQNENIDEGKEASAVQNAPLIHEDCIHATYACILNTESGKLAFTKNERERVAPASTTKMITALVVMDYCNLWDEVTVGEEIQQIAKDASRAGLYQGDILTVQDLLYALLLPSGNDAAYTLATYTGRILSQNQELDSLKAVDCFVEKMNEKATKIGAMNTNFVRPDGYDADGQYSTAYDLALIGAELMKNQTLSEIVGSSQKRCLFTSGEDVTYLNTNELLDSSSERYDGNVVGIKTGSSDAAGKCLVSAVRIQGVLYVCVVLGDSEDGRYEDTQQLYQLLGES